MRLNEGKEIAEALVEHLRPACERVEVAGSIRRHKPQVKDIEIVFLTKYREEAIQGVQMNLFSLDGSPPETVMVPAIDGTVQALIDEGVLAWDEKVRRRGTKYKRLIHLPSRAVVELFGGTEENWGLVYAVRTGPGDFNQKVVSCCEIGGAMPLGMRMEGGHLWYGNRRLATPTEEYYFACLELPYWPPEARTAGALAAWLADAPPGRKMPRFVQYQIKEGE